MANASLRNSQIPPSSDAYSDEEIFRHRISLQSHPGWFERSEHAEILARLKNSEDAQTSVSRYLLRLLDLLPEAFDIDDIDDATLPQWVLLDGARIEQLAFMLGLSVHHVLLSQVVRTKIQHALIGEIGEEAYVFALRNMAFLLKEWPDFAALRVVTIDEVKDEEACCGLKEALIESGLRVLYLVALDLPGGVFGRVLIKLSPNYFDRMKDLLLADGHDGSDGYDFMTDRDMEKLELLVTKMLRRMT